MTMSRSKAETLRRELNKYQTIYSQECFRKGCDEISSSYYTKLQKCLESAKTNKDPLFCMDSSGTNLLALVNYRLGLKERNSKFSEQAKELNEEVLRKDSCNLSAAVLKCHMLLDQGKNSKAEEHMRKIQGSENIGNIIATGKAELAFAYLQLDPRHLERVVALYVEVLQNEENSALISLYRYRLAKACSRLLNKGNTTDNKEDPQKYYKLAYKQLVEGIYQNDCPPFLKARALVDIAFAYKKCETTLHVKNPDPALPYDWDFDKCIAEAEKIDPRDPHVLHQCGNHIRQRATTITQFKKAEKKLLESIKMIPNHVAHHHLALTYKAMWHIEREHKQTKLYANEKRGGPNKLRGKRRQKKKSIGSHSKGDRCGPMNLSESMDLPESKPESCNAETIGCDNAEESHQCDSGIDHSLLDSRDSEVSPRQDVSMESDEGLNVDLSGGNQSNNYGISKMLVSHEGRGGTPHKPTNSKGSHPKGFECATLHSPSEAVAGSQQCDSGIGCSHTGSSYSEDSSRQDVSMGSDEGVNVSPPESLALSSGADAEGLPRKEAPIISPLHVDQVPQAVDRQSENPKRKSTLSRPTFHPYDSVIWGEIPKHGKDPKYFDILRAENPVDEVPGDYFCKYHENLVKANEMVCQTSCRYLVDLGRAYASEMKFEDAVENFRCAADTEYNVNDESYLYEQWGLLYKEHGEKLENVVESDAKDLFHISVQAVTRMRDRSKVAFYKLRDILENECKADSSNCDAKRALAQLFSIVGNNEKALQVLEHDPDTHEDYILYLNKAGKHCEAYTHLLLIPPPKAESGIGLREVSDSGTYEDGGNHDSEQANPVRTKPYFIQTTFHAAVQERKFKTPDKAYSHLYRSFGPRKHEKTLDAYIYCPFNEDGSEQNVKAIHKLLKGWELVVESSLDILLGGSVFKCLEMNCKKAVFVLVYLNDKAEGDAMTNDTEVLGDTQLENMAACGLQLNIVCIKQNAAVVIPFCLQKYPSICSPGENLENNFPFMQNLMCRLLEVDEESLPNFE